MSSDMPQDPFTELAKAAIQLHELFKAFLDAGFTEPQAMQLVCTALTAGITKGSQG
ncbi:hypothetical protein [uncultured Thermomonospora sp.]|uniref:hypothetical protein n=1 Tax=uncultured Thermomonospora sp. TaxID=671175 RepID=UPI00259B8037|nr:hypothetical protein [uncultured Thermomonospora sp.]